MRFVAGVKEFTPAVGGHGEKLSFVSCRDVERAIGAEGQVPNVFRLGIKENGLLPGGGNLVDLAVGRSADVKRAL